MRVIDTRVVVLKTGSILRQGTLVKDSRSTVTLVDTGTKRIIVDTGYLGEDGILTDSLSARGLAPTDIDFVVNTHLHLDHCGCNLMFRQSVFYADRKENPPAYFRAAADGKELVPGVKFLSTPGHTKGSLSLIVKTDSKTYAIVGDAIPTVENYESMTPPAINIDPRLAKESMKRILKIADIVVPGHGAQFDVRR
jgi:glyoxylase-like metal-dependent hydrolase (beta-lactamase superfamily II)